MPQRGCTAYGGPASSARYESDGLACHSNLGTLKMSWRDMVVILFAGIVIWALAAGRITAKEALYVIAAILVGKSLIA